MKTDQTTSYNRVIIILDIENKSGITVKKIDKLINKLKRSVKDKNNIIKVEVEELERWNVKENDHV